MKSVHNSPPPVIFHAASFAGTEKLDYMMPPNPLWLSPVLRYSCLYSHMGAMGMRGNVDRRELHAG